MTTVTFVVQEESRVSKEGGVEEGEEDVTGVSEMRDRHFHMAFELTSRHAFKSIRLPKEQQHFPANLY